MANGKSDVNGLPGMLDRHSSKSVVADLPNVQCVVPVDAERVDHGGDEGVLGRLDGPTTLNRSTVGSWICDGRERGAICIKK